MKMRFSLLGFTLFLIFGIIIFTAQGFGNPLDTTSIPNKISNLKVSHFDKTLVGVNLGTAADISSVTLTFKSNVEDNGTVNISLKNNNDVEIGAGSKVVSPKSSTAVVSLTDSVTAIERDSLVSAIVTCTACTVTGSETLTIVDGFDEQSNDTLENLGFTSKVQTSNNVWLEMQSGYYTTFEFSNPTIPGGSTLISVIIYVEYYSECDFSNGLEWTTDGSSTNPPDNECEGSESEQSWDVSSIITTFAEVDALELKIENSDSGGKKTKTDYIYAVVGWEEP